MRIKQEIPWFRVAYGVGFAGWDFFQAVWGDSWQWVAWLAAGFFVLFTLASVLEFEPGSAATSAPGAAFSAKSFDFDVGEVYGLRAWKMDDHGRLRPLHIDSAEAWRPGVNTARCRKSSLDRFSLTFVYLRDDKKPPEHNVPRESCGCGFYAYTDLRHRENRANSRNHYVLGVIRGTGRTLIGTKGFRAEKAEIVALLDPTRGGRLPSAWRRRQKRLLHAVYPEVPLLPSKQALANYRPIERFTPSPADDEFWSLP